MGLLDRLPKEQQDFLVITAGAIFGKNGGSIEPILTDIANLYRSLHYGWGEAVLNNLWYRFPGEIQHMRFCSEEALKNYLLCRLLCLPTHYYVVENYYEMGVAHELVTVELGKDLYLLDWGAFKVKLTNRGFRKLDGSLVTFDRMSEIAGNEILDRVYELRESVSFLEALTSGQYLVRHFSPKGCLEILVKYNPQTAVLDYWFTMFPFAANYHFYLHQRLYANSKREEEIGVLSEKRGLNFTSVPLCQVRDPKETMNFIMEGRLPFLSEEQQRLAWEHCLWEDCFLSRQLLPYDQSEVEYALGRCQQMVQQKGKEAAAQKWVLDNYEEISHTSPTSANIFVMTLLFQENCRRFYPTLKELEAHGRNVTRQRSTEEAIRESLLICVVDLARMLQLKEIVRIQQTIQAQIVRIADIGPYEFMPPRFFDVLKFMQRRFSNN